MSKRKQTKVVYKNLRNYWGFADFDNNIIELSTKLKGQRHLETLIHEKLHLLFPDITEEAINRMGIDIAKLLWGQGYRRKNDT